MGRERERCGVALRHCGSQLAIQIATTCIRRCAWFTFHFQYYLGYIMWRRLQGHGVSDFGSFAHYLHHPVEYDEYVL